MPDDLVKFNREIISVVKSYISDAIQKGGSAVL